MNDILNKINKIFNYKNLINYDNNYNLLKKLHSYIFLINIYKNVNEKDVSVWYNKCIEIINKKKI